MFITNFALAILEMKREKTTIFESKVEISRPERQDAIRETVAITDGDPLDRKIC
jgi:hypothetical protein